MKGMVIYMLNQKRKKEIKKFWKDYVYISSKLELISHDQFLNSTCSDLMVMLDGVKRYVMTNNILPEYWGSIKDNTYSFIKRMDPMDSEDLYQKWCCTCCGVPNI